VSVADDLVNPKELVEPSVLTDVQPEPEAAAVMTQLAVNEPVARRQGRRKIGGVLGWGIGILIGALVVLVILPLFFRYSPDKLGAGPPLAHPSGAHWFGTDTLGRDVYARVVIGARYSLFVGVVSAIGSLLVGAPLGALAAVGGRVFEAIIMRSVDVLMAFPGLLLVIVLATVLGPSLSTTVIALVILNCAPVARLVRAAILGERGEDYVLAARLIGGSRRRVVTYHIGANIALPLLVFGTLLISDGMVTEAALSFLGAGIQPPTPSWGNVISDGVAVVLSGSWWVGLFPCIALVISVFCINRFAEAFGRDLVSR
jgi:ABC-type dipeptide/oligopeptide/nickel transport system permease subunit